MISNNIELVEAVKNEIKNSGIKKTFIAEKLGISRQAFSNLLAKQNFSIDDANKILSIIGKSVNAEIVNKKDEK